MCRSCASSRTTYGQRGIGFWSGIQLLINNMVGPALVLIPSLFQKYGYVPVLSMLSIACLLSFFSGAMLTHVIQHIITCSNIANSSNNTDNDNSDEHNNNNNAQPRTIRPEMNHIIDFYFSSYHKYIRGSILSIYIATLITTLMSNIIQSAQVIDLAIRDIFGCSYALQIYPDFFQIVCGKQHSDVTPFGPDIYVLSMGFVVLSWVCLVIYSVNYNLDDNIMLQWVANIGLIVLSIIWLSIFFMQDTFDADRVQVVNNEYNENGNYSYNDCVGVMLFNFAFIVTIPSWYNEKADNVPVIKSLLYSILFVIVLFLVLGILGAMAFQSIDLSQENQSLFTVIDDFGGSIGKASVYLYPIIQNITSIPVFCIIIRYNVQNAGLNQFQSNLISILIPWLLAVPLFTGSGFSELCDLSGIFMASFVNFILPPYLYILAVQRENVHNIMDVIPIDDKSESENDGGGGARGNEDDDEVSNLVIAGGVGSIGDDDASEQLQLIEMGQMQMRSDERTDIIGGEPDIDSVKKYRLRCTWDVAIAIVCIVISSVLSIVVIMEKIYDLNHLK